MGDAGKTSRENQRKKKLEEAVRKREAAIQEREAAIREREKKSPYRNFAQLNREKIPHLDRACRDNPTAVRILLFIMQHMDYCNALLCPYQVFVKYLGLSQATVARGLRYLREKGFISVEKKPGIGNTYLLNDELAWTSSMANRNKKSRFPGKIGLTAATGEDEERARRIRFDRMASASLREDGDGGA